MSNKKKSVSQIEFITLHVSQIGFVVYGIGGGAQYCTFQGENLDKFLGNLWTKMWRIKDELNRAWKKLDKKPFSMVRIDRSLKNI